VEEAENNGVPVVGDPERFGDAHRELVADPALQFDLRPLEQEPIPGWLVRLIEMLQDSGPFFRFLFWTIAALAVVAILYAVARWLDGRSILGRRNETGEPEAEVWRPAEAPARALLQEADALAAAGRFSEAAHLLLFRSINEIDRRKPNLVRPALTSRDLASAPSIPERPRAAFARIVMFVERSLFGGSSLSAADWGLCRQAYEAFAFAPEWKS
jgi:hypothetical protein